MKPDSLKRESTVPDDGMPVWMGPGRPPFPWEKPPIRDTCPVHTATPEPCPECESKIAAGL